MIVLEAGHVSNCSQVSSFEMKLWGMDFCRIDILLNTIFAFVYAAWHCFIKNSSLLTLLKGGKRLNAV
jgi:hypothetical protein